MCVIVVSCTKTEYHDSTQFPGTYQGCSQEFQKGFSINGRMSIKQGSVGVQFQMLTSRTHVHFEFITFLPNKLASEPFHIAN